MKTKLILGAIIAMLSFASISDAQHVKAFKGAEFLPASDPGGVDIVTISYTGLEDGSVRFLMATIPARTREECFASRDLSTAVAVGPETVISKYDPETNTTTHVWYLRSGDIPSFPSKPSCQLMLATSGGRVDAADYMIWRSSVSQTVPTSFQDPEKLDSGRFETNKTTVASYTLKFFDRVH